MQPSQQDILRNSISLFIITNCLSYAWWINSMSPPFQLLISHALLASQWQTAQQQTPGQAVPASWQEEMRLCYWYIFRGQMSKPPCSVMVKWKVTPRQGRTDPWASHEDFKEFKNRDKSLENRSLLASLLRSVNNMPCGKKIEDDGFGYFFPWIPYLQIWLPIHTQLHQQGQSFQDFTKNVKKILYFCKENCSFKEPGHILVSIIC